MRFDRIFSVWKAAGPASVASGRSRLELLAEIVKLRFSAARLATSEYFDFRLYESNLTNAERRAFGGYRVQNVLDEILIDDYSKILSLDKISFYTLMRGAGLAIPKIVAIYAGGNRPGPFLNLHTRADLETFLGNYKDYPLYLKPSFGSYGAFNIVITATDGTSVTLADGSNVSIGVFCDSLKDRTGFGWIFQEVLEAHPDIATLCGTNKISGMRVHSFLTPTGAKIIRAIWKINVGKLDSDNFKHGTSGNMLAAIDLDTGKVQRVVTGVGPTQVVDPVHPVTRLPLVNFKVPLWEQIRDLVLGASPAFPGFLCQGWDIAICPDQPVALEVNIFGDIDLPQHSYRRGFLDDGFMGLLRERGLDTLVTASPRARQVNPENARRGRRKAHWPW